MTSSIANETVDHSKNREPFSFYKFITNKYFLNVVSIVLFLALWDYVAKEKIFRDSLARPLEVVDQLYRLTYMKFAGTNLIGHIWASTQRVLIGFIAASVVAVPLGLFMALNKYVNAIVKPLFDLFKPMPSREFISSAARTQVQAELREIWRPAKTAGNDAGKHTWKISSRRLPPRTRITSYRSGSTRRTPLYALDRKSTRLNSSH